MKTSQHWTSHGDVISEAKELVTKLEAEQEELLIARSLITATLEAARDGLVEARASLLRCEMRSAPKFDWEKLLAYVPGDKAYKEMKQAFQAASPGGHVSATTVMVAAPAQYVVNVRFNEASRGVLPEIVALLEDILQVVKPMPQNCGFAGEKLIKVHEPSLSEFGTYFLHVDPLGNVMLKRHGVTSPKATFTVVGLHAALERLQASYSFSDES